MAGLPVNAAPAMHMLQQEGVSKAGAAALVGNWTQESNVNPADPGGGIAQWQGPRAAALNDYAAQTGDHPGTLAAQVGFAVHELKSQYPGLWSALQKGGDPAQLALAVSQQYERPGIPRNENRVAYARQAFGLNTPVQPPGFPPTSVPRAPGSPQLPGRAASPGVMVVGSEGPIVTGTRQVQVPLSPQETAQREAAKAAAQDQLLRAQDLQQFLGASGGMSGLTGAERSLLQDAANEKASAASHTLSQIAKQPTTHLYTEQTATAMSAQKGLQELAGTTPLVPHPATGAGVPGTGGNKVAAMTRMADHLVGKPYVWGGGHGGWGPQGGYDCSGFVSAVLHAAGYLGAPQTTQTLPGQHDIANGPGRFVTVYDRTDGGTPGNDHVIIDLNGSWYEAGGNAQLNRSGGVSRIQKPDAAYLSSFNRRLHPMGL